MTIPDQEHHHMTYTTTIRMSATDHSVTHAGQTVDLSRAGHKDFRLTAALLCDIHGIRAQLSKKRRGRKAR